MSTNAPATDGAAVAAVIDAAAYQRLLGLPAHRPLDGPLAERAAWARDWYRANGMPMLRTVRYGITGLGAGTVGLQGGLRFASATLVARLRHCEAHAVLLLAASAGAALDAACERLWQEDRPDDAWFLERFGVAVVEHLVFQGTLGACRQSAAHGDTVTLHLSPGCGGWDLGDQRLLWRAIFGDDDGDAIRLLDSGALAPKCSVLAAAGIARRRLPAEAPVVACRACDLPRCAFRRAAFRSQP